MDSSNHYKQRSTLQSLAGLSCHQMLRLSVSMDPSVTPRHVRFNSDSERSKRDKLPTVSTNLNDHPPIPRDLNLTNDALLYFLLRYVYRNVKTTMLRIHL